MVLNLALVLMVVAAACQAEGQQGRPRLTPAEETACVGRGGHVAIAGIRGGTFCAEPAVDAGKSCSRASDCTVRCEAKTRTCATHADPFGCRVFLDEDGRTRERCVD